MGFSAWLQGRAFRMNAVAVFVALLFFGWLWGGWGLLVGVPLLAVVKTTADRIPSLERFASLLADDRASGQRRHRREALTVLQARRVFHRHAHSSFQPQRAGCSASLLNHDEIRLACRVASVSVANRAPTGRSPDEGARMNWDRIKATGSR